PNPFVRELTIGFAVRERQPVKVSLFDMLGRLRGVAFDEIVDGNEHTLVRVADLGDLASGVYILRVQGQHFASDHRVVRVK
ncbi:MAG: T9SS type A sorting domain-containing protein, partial [Rhodothermales bacterium]|nr:T9SS type A sorting domain-containing protein [Rhodothermales bacterium]